MPIIFVDEKILDCKVDCVVCPVRLSKYRLFEDICGLIYKKAGHKELLNEFDSIISTEIENPYITCGFNLAKDIIHIIGADMIASPNFKTDLYNSYNKVFSLIAKKQYSSVIFPPICFSNKRLGKMHSYRTCITLINHFINLYNIFDTTFYILITKQTMKDHLDNYASSYISTSKLTRRHNQIIFPFNNHKELEQYIQSNKHYENQLESNIFCVNIKNKVLCDLCQEILVKFKYNSTLFCIKSNICKDTLIKLFTSNYIPSLDELIGIFMALELELIDVLYYLNKLNYSFDYQNIKDCYIISHIATHNYDVSRLNQRLFIGELSQIGSKL